MALTSLNGSDGPVANINVTPLVDVMLVLLVIFMITAPMLQQGVEVNLPKASTGPVQSQTEQVVVSVTKNGEIFIGAGNKIDLKDLGNKIKGVMASRAEDDRKVYIKADQALEYGRIMDVMGRLHEAGIAQIGLISAPVGGRQVADSKKAEGQDKLGGVVGRK